MDGLECSEVQYSMLFPDNLIFRLDSEFYNSKAISIDSKLKEMTHFCLKQDEVVSGPFGSALKSDAYLTEGDIPFVRIENIRGGFDINMDNIIYISSQDNNRIKNSQLHVDDIVLSKVGNSIGFFARVDESVGVCNISENNIGIKLAKYSTIEKHYILTYLNCKHAQMLVLRRTSGNAQPKLNVGDLCHIPIPQFTNRFYESISKTILQSKSLVLQSQKLYSSAELILKNEFHIEQNNAPTAIKSLSESFKKTGRLDAEYYQKKYERYSKSLHTSETVESLCKLHDKTFLPKENESYQYIELSNVGLAGEISGVDTISGAELPSRARRKVKTGQIVISSVEGSLQSCALITDDLDECLCSTGFYILDSKDINPETLLVLFKSEVIQALMKQRCSGTILAGITKDELLSMPLPKVDEKLQKAIAAKVQESFDLRHQSKQLLEYAKQAVEMAIEQGEDTALAWLKERSGE